MVSAILLQCGNKDSQADATATTPKPTDKLVADLQSEYGLFTNTFMTAFNACVLSNTAISVIAISLICSGTQLVSRST
jgi:hypothetical protein